MPEELRRPPFWVGYVPVFVLLGTAALFDWLWSGWGWVAGAVLGFFVSKALLRAYFVRRMEPRSPVG